MIGCKSKAVNDSTAGNNRLSDMMQLAVPLYMAKLSAKGGPTKEDMAKAQELSDILGERGDVLLFGGGKKGECAELFNRTAKAIAVLSFCPGGVSVFGCHWEAKK